MRSQLCFARSLTKLSLLLCPSANTRTSFLQTYEKKQQEIVETTMVLDVASIRLLQSICLRLERLVSGAGRATEQMLVLLSLPIRDNADQDDLVRIADNCISRIEVRLLHVFVSTLCNPFQYEVLKIKTLAFEPQTNLRTCA